MVWGSGFTGHIVIIWIVRNIFRSENDILSFIALVIVFVYCFARQVANANELKLKFDVELICVCL